MESGLDPAGFKLRSGLSRLVICSLLKRSDSHGPAPRYHVDSGSHFCAIALKPSFGFVLVAVWNRQRWKPRNGVAGRSMLRQMEAGV